MASCIHHRGLPNILWIEVSFSLFTRLHPSYGYSFVSYSLLAFLFYYLLPYLQSPHCFLADNEGIALFSKERKLPKYRFFEKGYRS